MSKRYKILVRGPALSASGYGEQTRFALQCLRSREDLFDILLVPINWGKTGWISKDDEERRWLDHLIMKTNFHLQNKEPLDASLQVTIPNEWEKLAPINVGYTAGIECNRVAPVWVQKSFLMDRIITTSKHSTDTYVNSSYEATNEQTGDIIKDYCVQVPVEAVNYGVRYTNPEPLDIDFSTDFNLLTVAQWGPRKNVENTIRWFIEEFREIEDAGLILKTSLMRNAVIDRHFCLERVQALIESCGEKKCKIHFLHGSLTDGQMCSLYNHPKVKGLLSLSHGEGFGLPLFEAVCNGLPVLACDWSGHKDFLYGNVKDKKGKMKKKPLFTKIDYTLSQIPPEAVWKNVMEPGTSWCDATEKSCKLKLREFYKNHTVAIGKAKKLKKHVLKEFAAEKKHAEFVEQILLAVAPLGDPGEDSVLVFD